MRAAEIEQKAIEGLQRDYVEGNDCIWSMGSVMKCIAMKSCQLQKWRLLQIRDTPGSLKCSAENCDVVMHPQCYDYYFPGATDQHALCPIHNKREPTVPENGTFTQKMYNDNDQQWFGGSFTNNDSSEEESSSESDSGGSEEISTGNGEEKLEGVTKDGTGKTANEAVISTVSQRGESGHAGFVCVLHWPSHVLRLLLCFCFPFLISPSYVFMFNGTCTGRRFQGA